MLGSPAQGQSKAWTPRASYKPRVARALLGSLLLADHSCGQLLPAPEGAGSRGPCVARLGSCSGGEPAPGLKWRTRLGCLPRCPSTLGQGRGRRQRAGGTERSERVGAGHAGHRHTRATFLAKNLRALRDATCQAEVPEAGGDEGDDSPDRWGTPGAPQGLLRLTLRAPQAFGGAGNLPPPSSVLSMLPHLPNGTRQPLCPAFGPQRGLPRGCRPPPSPCAERAPRALPLPGGARTGESPESCMSRAFG